MKKHGMGIALLSVILCVLMAGCAAAPELQQPTLEELLAGVNAKHQSVEQKPMDRGRYLRQAPDQAALEQYQIGEDGAKPFDLDAVITATQAARDVEYLFGAFAALYGPYDYLGGAEVFDAHKAEILARCGEQESWTAQAFQDLLLDGLAFLPDAHFNINGGHTNLFQVPFFFRETDFYKTDGGYQTAEGKRVESVDNHPDLEGLFKPSISPEGEIVYYPILLEPGGVERPDADLQRGPHHSIHRRQQRNPDRRAVPAVQLGKLGGLCKQSAGRQEDRDHRPAGNRRDPGL